MINAEEARRKTIINTKAKELISIIERFINNAIKHGIMNTSVPLSDSYKRDIIDAVVNELKSLGYHAKYEKAKPIPPGCPSDQWYSEDCLKISWEELDE